MYRELFTCDKPCLRVGECMLFMEVLLHEIFEVLVAVSYTHLTLPTKVRV